MEKSAKTARKESNRSASLFCLQKYLLMQCPTRHPRQPSAVVRSRWKEAPLRRFATGLSSGEGRGGLLRARRSKEGLGAPSRPPAPSSHGASPPRAFRRPLGPMQPLPAWLPPGRNPPPSFPCPRRTTATALQSCGDSMQAALAFGRHGREALKPGGREETGS